MTGRTELHICQGNVTGLYYLDNGIQSSVMLYSRQHGNVFICQDNIAKAQCAHVVQDHLQFH